jgi:hypothetical protein
VGHGEKGVKIINYRGVVWSTIHVNDNMKGSRMGE